jgi:hypothetical protein
MVQLHEADEEAPLDNDCDILHAASNQLNFI